MSICSSSIPLEAVYCLARVMADLPPDGLDPRSLPEPWAGICLVVGGEGAQRRIEALQAQLAVHEIDEAAVAKAICEVELQAPKVNPSPRAGALAKVVEVFQRWLFMPDPGALLVCLAAVVGNRLPGDPIWLLLVAPPGSGKTEILNCVVKLPEAHAVSTLTEASLLSGTGQRDRAQGATGGLLKKIGHYGLLVVKDFGGVLSLNRDTRAGILAAMREIYDGSWTRQVGTDGGQELSWQGKVGLVGGSTPAIDQHHGIMSSLGERFVFYRLPSVDGQQLAYKALAHQGQEQAMREELTQVVSELLAGIPAQQGPISLRPAEKKALVAMATLATKARSPVERDSYTRDIALIPGSEAPTRLVLVLAHLLTGLVAVGVERTEALGLVSKVALDSMPKMRQDVLVALLGASGEQSTSSIAQKLGYPTSTVRRALEDLACYGVVERRSTGHGQSDVWEMSQWTRHTYAEATSVKASLELVA